MASGKAHSAAGISDEARHVVDLLAKVEKVEGSATFERSVHDTIIVVSGVSRTC